MARRLELWKRGEEDSVLRKGCMTHLVMSRKADPPNKAKRFAKLVTEGKMNSALRCLSEEYCGGVLPLTEHVMRQLMDKHPKAQEA